MQKFWSGWLALVVTALVLVLAYSTAGRAQVQPVQLRPPYQVSVGTAAVQITSSGMVRGVLFQALSPGQTIYLGIDNTVTTANGWPMGDGSTFNSEILNASQIWAIASAPSQKLAVWPYRR